MQQSQIGLVKLKGETVLVKRNLTNSLLKTLQICNVASLAIIFNIKFGFKISFLERKFDTYLTNSITFNFYITIYKILINLN